MLAYRPIKNNKEKSIVGNKKKVVGKQKNWI